MKKKFNDITGILSKSERRQFAWLAVLDITVSVLDIVFLVALLYVVGFYTKTSQAGSLFFTGVSFFEENPLFLISVFFGLFSLKNLLGYVLNKMQFRFVYSVASRISKNNLAQYFESDYLDYVTIDSSVQIRRISQQPVEFAHYVLRGLQQIISNVALLVLAVIPLFLFNPLLAGLLVVVLFPPVLLTMIISKKKLLLVRKANKQNREKTIQHLQESLDGFIEINVYQHKKYFTDRYALFQEKFNQSLADLQAVQTIPSKMMEVFAVFGLFALVAATTLFKFTGNLHVLLIGGFMAAAYKIIPGVVKILNSWEHINTYAFTIEDLKNRASLDLTDPKASLAPLHSVNCNNLRFAYNGKPVLKGFSLQMQKGDFAGLKGISGAGKTSFINILLGFLSPSEGELFMNEERADIKKRKDYWSRISYARQQPFFIHETILSNIILSAPKNESRLAEIIGVTGIDKLAGSDGKNIEAVLTEKAKNISGGQKQRIILARTLYRDADLYILDEPFNELDRGSAAKLLALLQKMAAAGKMVLMVTHDDHSLAYCNKVISMNES